MNVAAAPAPTEGITLKHGSDLHLGGVVDPIAEVEGHVVDVGEQHPADSDLYAIVRSIDLNCLFGMRTMMDSTDSTTGTVHPLGTRVRSVDGRIPPVSSMTPTGPHPTYAASTWITTSCTSSTTTHPARPRYRRRPRG